MTVEEMAEKFTSCMVTHERDDYGEVACGSRNGRLGDPGKSTCGHAACRDARAEVRDRLAGDRRARDPSLAKTPARRYALEAYQLLESTPCPGGEGHEGRGGRDYCTACIIDALEDVYRVGTKAGR